MPRTPKEHGQVVSAGMQQLLLLNSRALFCLYNAMSSTAPADVQIQLSKAHDTLKQVDTLMGKIAESMDALANPPMIHANG